MLLLFILYLIIAYFIQFNPLLYELTLSADHSVGFANYPTSLFWDSSKTLYSQLSRTKTIQITTSIQIDPIRSVLSDVWHITDPIEETPYHQFVLILYQPQ